MLPPWSRIVCVLNIVHACAVRLRALIVEAFICVMLNKDVLVCRICERNGKVGRCHLWSWPGHSESNLTLNLKGGIILVFHYFVGKQSRAIVERG